MYFYLSITLYTPRFDLLGYIYLLFGVVLFFVFVFLSTTTFGVFFLGHCYIPKGGILLFFACLFTCLLLFLVLVFLFLFSWGYIMALENLLYVGYGAGRRVGGSGYYYYLLLLLRGLGLGYGFSTLLSCFALVVWVHGTAQYSTAWYGIV